MGILNARWAYEIHKKNVLLGFKIKKVLFSAKSKYQTIKIIESLDHGRILMLDDYFMITEKDEFIYHEMISHVPLCVHPNPQKVLIIGGGDGGTVREVLKHSSVTSCTLVEIDDLVIRACKKFIPSTAASLDDSRVTVIAQDGVKFVETTHECFDVIIIDSSDPIGPAVQLFEPPFYLKVRRILNNPGIVISQAESPLYHLDRQKKRLSFLKKIFPQQVHIYNYTTLTYPGGLWSFTYASQMLNPIENLNRNKMQKLNLKYYNSEIHEAAFVLPPFMKHALKKQLTPFK